MGDQNGDATDFQLNSTAASLLGFLHSGEQSGWDLVRIAQATIGDFWTLTPSQVYRELARMSQYGLVSKGAAGPRSRIPYTLTGTGSSAFRAWVAQEPDDETIRFPLLLTLTFSEHLPRRTVHEMIARHRARHANTLDRYRHQYDEGSAHTDPDDPYALAALEFGLAYEKAVIAWCDALLAR